MFKAGLVKNLLFLITSASQSQSSLKFYTSPSGLYTVATGDQFYLNCTAGGRYDDTSLHLPYSFTSNFPFFLSLPLPLSLSFFLSSLPHLFFALCRPSVCPSFLPWSLLIFRLSRSPSFLPSFLPSSVPPFLYSFPPPSVLPSFSLFLPTSLRSFLLFFIPSYLPSFVFSFVRSFVRSFVTSFLPSFLRSFLPFYLAS